MHGYKENWLIALRISDDTPILDVHLLAILLAQHVPRQGTRTIKHVLQDYEDGPLPHGTLDVDMGKLTQTIEEVYHLRIEIDNLWPNPSGYHRRVSTISCIEHLSPS